MDIRAVVPARVVPSAPSVATTAALGQREPAAAAVAAAQSLQPTTPPQRSEAPRMVKLRAELRYDETINRVVGRVIDDTTGKEIREIPPEALRQLYAKTREMLGPLVDEKA